MSYLRFPTSAEAIKYAVETVETAALTPRSSSVKIDMKGLRFAQLQSTAMMTSEDLITAEAAIPGFNPSASTASLVSEDVITVPPMSIRT